MKALIIIDMLNDFVTGVLNNQAHASKIIPNIKALLDYARSQPDWIILFSNDAHHDDDREMGVWGKHAMKDTDGAKVIPELEPIIGEREYNVPKRFYGGFDETEMGEICKKHGITEVYLTGQHTHCCVRHTAYGAFTRGYGINIIEDGVCVFDGVDNAAAIEYLKTIYGSTITNSNSVIVKA
ncbi:amidase [Heterostelium album PN500]|uniref:Amidase n=1 Tax=Heterostelium pallidum (strain ATCC 26659 / Pp 5 / PN500) TaxID=670386 RepID=D3BMW8_HETP5|nr:amidase [Heterostelium album PN500]EFA77330.1 amidase [Heterostelium album PN500]|eukprot:XP_020429459.1 amidase [Heterostelium album PN500]